MPREAESRTAVVGRSSGCEYWVFWGQRNTRDAQERRPYRLWSRADGKRFRFHIACFKRRRRKARGRGCVRQQAMQRAQSKPAWEKRYRPGNGNKVQVSRLAFLPREVLRGSPRPRLNHSGNRIRQEELRNGCPRNYRDSCRSSFPLTAYFLLKKIVSLANADRSHSCRPTVLAFPC